MKKSTDQKVDSDQIEDDKRIIDEVIEALRNIRGWGSVEIFVQDHKVVQIVERNIKKTYNKISTIASSKMK